MVREAGGVITSPEGGEVVLDSGLFLAAANSALYPHLRGMARRVLGK